MHPTLQVSFVKNKNKHILGEKLINQISPCSFPSITYLSSSASQFKINKPFIQEEPNNKERVIQKLGGSESRKSKAITGPEGSQPILQDQATEPYREPAELTSVLIFAPHLDIGISSSFLPLRFPTKILHPLIFSYL